MVKSGPKLVPFFGLLLHLNSCVEWFSSKFELDLTWGMIDEDSLVSLILFIEKYAQRNQHL